MAHPNSLANLRPWRPGEKPPPPGPRKVEQALKIAQQNCPKAARLIARCIDDPEVPLGQRLRCAEYILDKALPNARTGAEGAALQINGGIECLELRFVAPGREVSETISLPLSTDTSSLKDKAISTTYSVEEQSSHTLSHTEDDAEGEGDV